MEETFFCSAKLVKEFKHFNTWRYLQHFTFLFQTDGEDDNNDYDDRDYKNYSDNDEGVEVDCFVSETRTLILQKGGRYFNHRRNYGRSFCREKIYFCD